MNEPAYKRMKVAHAKSCTRRAESFAPRGPDEEDRRENKTPPFLVDGQE